MSGNSRKRAAEVSTNELTSKRANTTRSGHIDTISLESSPEPKGAKKDNQAKHSNAKVDPATYDIAVELHSDYDIFPKHIRTSLQGMYQATIQSTMSRLTDKTLPKYPYYYSIISKRSVRDAGPNVGPNVTICKDNVAPLSIANTILLEIFLTTYGSALVKPKFVKLEKIAGIANPEFASLHLVRHGDIGWGFDLNSCLSFYLPSLKDVKLREYWIYVQKVEVKVEKVVKKEG
jgi:hypothetical protein